MTTTRCKQATPSRSRLSGRIEGGTFLLFKVPNWLMQGGGGGGGKSYGAGRGKARWAPMSISERLV